MLLIDTDNALGSTAGDVDDGLAVTALLRSGLSAVLASVGGNTSEEHADRNNRTLGALCGYRGPYLRGVQAGKVENRVDRQPWSEPLRIVALGPLTNAAALLDREISEIVIVGSNASSPGRFPPWWPHEFNLTHDLPAARAVFSSSIPLTVVPLDVAREMRVGKAELAELHGELGELLRRESARWLRRSRLIRWSSTFPAYDLPAAMYAMDPELVEVEETTAQCHPNLWIEYGRGGRPVRLVRGFDPRALWRRFVSLVNGRRD
ncbi:MAG TPA: nucleoside hydrolase [Thermoanaerobaculia bacterium]|nr:nucleoside hydrolase [Thermoanaerobaculia bacterium]